jgi:transketolase
MHVKPYLSGVINAPISLSEKQLEDLRRIVLRTIPKDQILVLTHVPRVPTSITSVLREVSRRFNIPVQDLRKHAKILKELKLIDYGEASAFKGVELTQLGSFIGNLSIADEPLLLEEIIQTKSGSRPFGLVIKDLRKMVLQMIANAGSGHLGASLSIIEILATLYFRKMQHDPKNPDWVERDRLVLSKGHAAPALYAVLAEAGYFPEKELLTLRALGSRLHGHPDTVLPGVDVKTGSLGQGLSIATGMAYAAKLDKAFFRIYAILGDGELNEGQIWEAALTAAQYNLDNLIVIVDRNKYQLTGMTEHVKGINPIADKWRAFGWNVMEVDGHDQYSVLDSLEVCEHYKEKPSVIIANTTKGKGISFMEGNKFSRSVPDQEQLRKALKELG